MKETIRKYRPSDKTQVERCMQELQDFEKTLDSDMRPGGEMKEAYIKSLLSCEGGQIYVAEVEGKIAGFIAVRTDTKNDLRIENDIACVLISDLVVHASYRRRGISGKLFEQAKKYAAERNIPLLKLSVLAHNAVARKVYEKAGFFEYEITLLKRVE